MGGGRRRRRGRGLGMGWFGGMGDGLFFWGCVGVDGVVSVEFGGGVGMFRLVFRCWVVEGGSEGVRFRLFSFLRV